MRFADNKSVGFPVLDTSSAHLSISPLYLLCKLTFLNRTPSIKVAVIATSQETALIPASLPIVCKGLQWMNDDSVTCR